MPCLTPLQAVLLCARTSHEPGSRSHLFRSTFRVYLYLFSMGKPWKGLFRFSPQSDLFSMCIFISRDLYSNDTCTPVWDCVCPAFQMTSGGLCPIGYYCPQGSAGPTACDSGMYCETKGLAAPTGTSIHIITHSHNILTHIHAYTFTNRKSCADLSFVDNIWASEPQASHTFQ